MSKIDWFNDARFGMLITWGPYSVGGRGEWIFNRENIPLDEYRERYVLPWRAEQYDPRDWARVAKRAGMRYVVLTTRHCDGFCLWDTGTTDWKSTRIGPGRDLVAPYVDAMRAEGLGVGLYYSGADWHHPDYPDPYARDFPSAWPDADARLRVLSHCQAQVEELLTQYGKIDLLWYDGFAPHPFNGPAFNEHVYELQPDILLNDRNGEPCDYRNCEQRIVRQDGPWEACMTLNDNWAYFDSDEGYKSPAEVIRMLVMCAKDGGNLLLGVGPHPDGRLPEKAVSVLDRVGDWLGRNGEWMYGSSRSPFAWCEANCWLVCRRGRVYVLLLKSLGSEVCIAEIKNRVTRATRLDDRREVEFEQRGDRLFLRGLPKPLPEPLGMVIALEIEGPPTPIRKAEQFWIPG